MIYHLELTKMGKTVPKWKVPKKTTRKIEKRRKRKWKRKRKTLIGKLFKDPHQEALQKPSPGR